MKKTISMTKKFISLLLAVLFVFSVFSVSASASEADYTATIKLTSNKENPKPGDSFTVTVSAKTDYPIINVNTIVVYDSKYYALDTSSGAAVKKVTKMPVKMNSSTQSPLSTYHQSYSSEMAKRYKLVFSAITWLPSLSEQGTATPTTTLTEFEKLYTIKFKVKSNAPTDGAGFIGIDPIYLRNEFSTMRSGVYASRGGATLKDAAVAPYGQTIDLSQAVVFGSEVIKSAPDFTLSINYKDVKDVKDVFSTSDSYDYLSSNTSIIDTDGSSVSALKKGTAYLAATSKDGKTRYNCEVTVKYSFLQWLIIIFLFGWIWY